MSYSVHITKYNRSQLSCQSLDQKRLRKRYHSVHAEGDRINQWIVVAHFPTPQASYKGLHTGLLRCYR